MEANKAMNNFIQSTGQAVFTTTMSVKARVGFGVVAALPLLAPYQLLIKPDWGGTSGLAWFFTVIVSLGAVIVSVLLATVAIFGINRRVEFDPSAEIIRVTESHLAQRQCESIYRFNATIKFEILCHDWSDGPSTYEIRLIPVSGKSFSFGDFTSHTEAESAISALQAMMKRGSSLLRQSGINQTETAA